LSKFQSFAFAPLEEGALQKLEAHPMVCTRHHGCIATSAFSSFVFDLLPPPKHVFRENEHSLIGSGDRAQAYFASFREFGADFYGDLRREAFLEELVLQSTATGRTRAAP